MKGRRREIMKLLSLGTARVWLFHTTGEEKEALEIFGRFREQVIVPYHVAHPYNPRGPVPRWYHVDGKGLYNQIALIFCKEEDSDPSLVFKNFVEIGADDFAEYFLVVTGKVYEEIRGDLGEFLGLATNNPLYGGRVYIFCKSEEATRILLEIGRLCYEESPDYYQVEEFFINSEMKSLLLQGARYE